MKSVTLFLSLIYSLQAISCSMAPVDHFAEEEKESLLKLVRGLPVMKHYNVLSSKFTTLDLKYFWPGPMCPYGILLDADLEIEVKSLGLNQILNVSIKRSFISNKNIIPDIQNGPMEEKNYKTKYEIVID